MDGAREVIEGRSRPLPLWFMVLLAATLVLALAYFSIELTGATGRVASLWPANAVLLFFLLKAGPRRWLALLAAGWAANTLANALSGASPVLAMALSACNSVETALCAICLHKFAGRDLHLVHRRDFAVFAILCLFAPLVSSLLAAAVTHLSGGVWLLSDLGTWHMADALGLFILTPALLILGDRSNRRAAAKAFATGPRAPLIILGALLAITVVGPYHSAFLMAPPVMVLIVLEYELAGAAAAMLAVSASCVLLTVMGHPPAMLAGSGPEQLLRVQFFLAVTAAVMLPLGSVLSQRAANRRDLAVALDRAEAAAAAKGEFLATMSHELRTPLTSIIGFSGLLREDDTLDATQGRYVRRIAEASQALLSVINDVLDFSKLEAGEVRLAPRPTSPEAVIRQMVGLVGLQAQAKRLPLEMDLSPALPEHVLVDDGRLGQILLNLLSNAVKFTAEGEIRVTAAWADDRLTVSVADTGPGIAAGHLDRLFQRFSQADSSTSRRFGGSGLGLAISRSLAELMGGSIGVETTEGRGAVFTFEVDAPRAAAEAPALHQGRMAARPARRVLVIDDTPANRELVRALLESANLTVIEAEDGESGLAAAARERFDLIFMDVRMPRMDGLTATRRLRADPGPNQATPVLALTADVQPEDIAVCRDAGMDDHIAKPVSVTDLIGKAILWTTPSSEAARQGAAT